MKAFNLFGIKICVGRDVKPINPIPLSSPQDVDDCKLHINMAVVRVNPTDYSIYVNETYKVCQLRGFGRPPQFIFSQHEVFRIVDKYINHFGKDNVTVEGWSIYDV